MDNQTLIAEFDKNSAEKIRVSINEWKGQSYVDMRIWFYPDNSRDGEMIPSKKGIRISGELLPDLLKCLRKAGEKLGIGDLE